MTHKEGSNLPSAPPAEGITESSSSTTATQSPPPVPPPSSTPYVPSPPLVSSVPLGAPPPTTASASPYSEPPPSYQAAMAYPAVATPYPPGENGSFPKPSYGTPLPPCYNQLPPMGNQQFPPPPPQLGSSEAPPQARVVVNVQAPVSGNCAYCRIGNVTSETDLCCLMCLIILAIFTFPFGLLFLCCIPCTVHRRCNNCRRIG